MEWLLGIISQTASFIFPLVILLGLLIFVHELGHFLVAKYYGVKVEVFSLGFGKKIFQFKRGDTNYCVSLVPLGGYVKMYGDDFNNIPEADKDKAFLLKPVGQRIAIVLAGPVMNVVFAVFLFMLIAFLGENVVRPIVGDVPKDSAAYEQGFRSGDTILSVTSGQAEKNITTWNDVKTVVEATKSDKLTFVVERRNSGNESVVAKTDLIENPNILSSVEKVGNIEGLDYISEGTRIGVLHNSTAAKAGLKSFDDIILINSNRVERWYELEDALAQVTSGSVTIGYTRSSISGDVEESKVEIVPSAYPVTPQMLGFEKSALYISSVVDGHPAQAVGLRVGDKIVSINQSKVTKWTDLVDFVQGHGDDGLKIEVIREGQPLAFELLPAKIKKTTNTGAREDTFVIGVLGGGVLAQDRMVLVRILNPVAALLKGMGDTWKWTKLTILSFVKLVQKKVSARAIGGPIMIGQLASRTFKMGLDHFLKIMAIISINLFVINMLPVPVLDGGHLLFFSIEALRGAPVSMRKLEIAQQVGLVILLSLMIFAIFNDISRIVE